VPPLDEYRRATRAWAPELLDAPPFGQFSCSTGALVQPGAKIVTEACRQSVFVVPAQPTTRGVIAHRSILPPTRGDRLRLGSGTMGLVPDRDPAASDPVSGPSCALDAALTRIAALTIECRDHDDLARFYAAALTGQITHRRSGCSAGAALTRACGHQTRASRRP
jgi:hypothetical protein